MKENLDEKLGKFLNDDALNIIDVVESIGHEPLTPTFALCWSSEKMKEPVVDVPAKRRDR